MDPYRVSMKLLPSRANIPLTQGLDELRRASLPPPAAFSSGKPAQALAIWRDARRCVALDAADRADGFCQELTDEARTGPRTGFYEVVSGERGPRRSVRRRGVDDFHDRVWGGGR